MRVTSTYLAVVVLTLASLGTVRVASQGSVNAPFIGDDALARAMGTNQGQKGNGNYSCDDVNAASGQYSNYSCQNATNIPQNATCVQCVDVYTSGFLTNGQGGQIVPAGSVDCSRGGKGSQKKVGNCVPNANNTGGSCETMTPMGNCSGSFNNWIAQDNPQ